MEAEGVFFEIKDYKLTKTMLGKGTFGKVYVVERLEDGEQFAAKIISNEDDFNGRKQMLLLRESLILRKLNHPAIIKFIGVNFQTFPGYDLEDTKNKIHPTIITEYMKNGSLKNNLYAERKSIAKREWSPTKKYIILLGIADAMRYLHEHGIIHRDLKPENILNDSYFYPRICDFGLSRCLSDILNATQLSLTESVGTPLYMAPELFTENSNYDWSVDVYAFGILAYEIVTGHQPYYELGEKITIFQFADKIKSGYRPMLTEDLKNNDKMSNLLARCWDENKRRRPSFCKIYEELSKDFSYSLEGVNEDEIDNYIKDLEEARKNEKNEDARKNEKNEAHKKDEKIEDTEDDVEKNNNWYVLFAFLVGISVAVLFAAFFLYFCSNQLKTNANEELVNTNNINESHMINDRLQKNNIELKTRINQTIKMNLELQINIEKLKKEMDKLQKDNVQLYKKINQTQNLNNKLQFSINESQKNNEKLQGLIAQWHESNEELQKKNDELQKKYEKLQKNNQNLQQQINQSRILNEELQKKNDELQKKYEKLQKNNQNLQQQINQSRILSEELQKKNDELQIIYEKSEKNNPNLQKQINKSHELNEELVKLKEESSQSNNDIEFLNNTIEIFNSAPLMYQKLIISKIIKNCNLKNQMVYNYIHAIYYFISYLLEFKKFGPINCFQIDAENKNIQIQNLVCEFPIIILCNAIPFIYEYNLFQSQNFINSVKNFSHVTIEIKYPHASFDQYFSLASSFEEKIPNNRLKIRVFISEIDKTNSKFNNNIKIHSIRLDSSVKTIYGGIFGGSFQNCNSLIEIIIPPSVTSIGKYAFASCKKIKNIDIPSSVTYIGDYSFHECVELVKITIPNSVTSLGWGTFQGCKNLQEIIFPSSLTSIGMHCFDDCQKLKEINLPSSVKWIGIYCFSGCLSLIKIDLYLQKIPMGAFEGCKSLKQLTIPSTVEIISRDAFRRCIALEKVTITSSKIEVNHHAFFYCKSLKQVIITSSDAKIDDYAFPKNANVRRD